MSIPNEILKNVESIGIVCMNGNNLSPVAATLLRRMLTTSKKQKVREIQVSNVAYVRKEMNISNRALSYLQRKEQNTMRYAEIERISREWVYEKDIILTMDRFLKRDLKYDYSIKGKDMDNTVFTLTEVAGIDERIRDPGDDYSYDIDQIYDLIESCLKKIVELLNRVKK